MISDLSASNRKHNRIGGCHYTEKVKKTTTKKQQQTSYRLFTYNNKVTKLHLTSKNKIMRCTQRYSYGGGTWWHQMKAT